jgi:hypothetical protein
MTARNKGVTRCLSCSGRRRILRLHPLFCESSASLQGGERRFDRQQGPSELGFTVNHFGKARYKVGVPQSSSACPHVGAKRFAYLHCTWPPTQRARDLKVPCMQVGRLFEGAASHYSEAGTPPGAGRGSPTRPQATAARAAGQLCVRHHSAEESEGKSVPHFNARALVSSTFTSGGELARKTATGAHCNGHRVPKTP